MCGARTPEEATEMQGESVTLSMLQTFAALNPERAFYVWQYDEQQGTTEFLWRSSKCKQPEFWQEKDVEQKIVKLVWIVPKYNKQDPKVQQRIESYLARQTVETRSLIENFLKATQIRAKGRFGLLYRPDSHHRLVPKKGYQLCLQCVRSFTRARLPAHNSECAFDSEEEEEHVERKRIAQERKEEKKQAQEEELSKRVDILRCQTKQDDRWFSIPDPSRPRFRRIPCSRTIVVFDTETTGLCPKYAEFHETSRFDAARVVQLAVHEMVCLGRQVVSVRRWCSILHHPKESGVCTDDTIHIHGITNQDIWTASETFASFVKPLLPVLLKADLLISK